MDKLGALQWWSASPFLACIWEESMVPASHLQDSALGLTQQEGTLFVPPVHSRGRTEAMPLAGGRLGGWSWPCPAGFPRREQANYALFFHSAEPFYSLESKLLYTRFLLCHLPAVTQGKFFLRASISFSKKWISRCLP